MKLVLDDTSDNSDSSNSSSEEEPKITIAPSNVQQAVIQGKKRGCKPNTKFRILKKQRRQ